MTFDRSIGLDKFNAFKPTSTVTILTGNHGKGGRRVKLIESKLEQELREQLILSNESLFKNEEKKRLLKAIKSLFREMKTAYIIHWIPEQGEDI